MPSTLVFESIWTPQTLNFRGQISQKESDKRMKQLLPKFQAAKETLTKEERTYIDRLCQALTLILYMEVISHYNSLSKPYIDNKFLKNHTSPH